MLIYSLYEVYSLQGMFYLHTSRYDKRDDSNFPPANFLFLRGNLQSSSDDGVFFTHLKRYWSHVVLMTVLFWELTIRSYHRDETHERN